MSDGIGEGQLFKSSVFSDAQRNAVPQDVQDNFADAFRQIEDDMELGDKIYRLKPYDTFFVRNEEFIKKPDGQSELLRNYIFKLERSTLETYHKFVANKAELASLRKKLNKRKYKKNQRDSK